METCDRSLLPQQYYDDYKIQDGDGRIIISCICFLVRYSPLTSVPFITPGKEGDDGGIKGICGCLTARESNVWHLSSEPAWSLSCQTRDTGSQASTNT